MELIIPPTEPPCFETEPEGTPGIRISLWYQIEAQLDVEGKAHPYTIHKINHLL